MPIVKIKGKAKHYPYTKKGVAKAKAAARKAGAKVVMKKSKKKYA